MTTLSLLQKTIDLTDDILELRIDLNLDEVPKLGDLYKIALLYLGQSHETLSAVHLILRQGMQGPAEILVRHLFELYLRLNDMVDHPAKVAEFLRHSRLPDVEEPFSYEEFAKLLEKGDFSGLAKKYLPSGNWGNLREMAENANELDNYLTLYKMTSERAHGGVREMSSELVRLFGDNKNSALVLKVLYPALGYYNNILSINRRLFTHVEAAFDEFQRETHWNDRLRALMVEAKTWRDEN